jgi:hypothetical protein
VAMNFPPESKEISKPKLGGLDHRYDLAA